MAITKTTAFQISDGNTYPTLEIAQRAELLKLATSANNVTMEQANVVLDALFQRYDEMREILRCTGRRPRKAKGNGRPRARRNTAEKAEG